MRVSWLALAVLAACSGGEKPKPEESRAVSDIEKPEFQEGADICAICGRVEDFRYIHGNPIEVKAREPNEYAAWYKAHVDLPHECVWYTSGCLQTKSGGKTITACYVPGGATFWFHNGLPKFPIESARRFIRGAIKASKDERRAAFPDGWPGPDLVVDFDALADGAPDKFDERLNAYLDKHVPLRRIWDLGAP